MKTTIARWTWRVFRCIFILAALLVAIAVLSKFPDWVERAMRISAIRDTSFAVALRYEAREGVTIVAGLVAIWLATVALKRTFTEIER